MEPQSKGFSVTSQTMASSPPAANSPQPSRVWRTALIAGIVIGVFGLVGVILYFILLPMQNAPMLRTYFQYEQSEIDQLRKQSSLRVITIDEVQEWENKAYELVELHKDVDVEASKVYAYLNIAQMDAAALSLMAHKTFQGDIGVVSKEVLCQIYADSCGELIVQDDAYSSALATVVLSKIKARMTEEGAQLKDAVLKTGDQYWQGSAPRVGLSAPSFKPWFLATADQFRAAPSFDLNSDALPRELVEIKQRLAGATNEEKSIVIKWAGGPGTRTPPGIWLTLAADYMQTQRTPLDKYLETKAILSTAMADAVIAVFDAKYAYQQKRPNMYDRSIVTIMPTPNHPSYPAGHATISWAAATVLSAYLPENKQEWERQATEASDSRTIGGIHFSLDNIAGTTMGEQVGRETLKRWQGQ